ncbi:MAG: replication protein, partial [Magnetovibrio sp.]|nr:replication protein [Magnetovibrio sp.]
EYSCFVELTAREERGVDYEICARRKATSRVSVIAPHGDGIEPETSRIAENIAGAKFSLYLFSGAQT